MKRAHPHEGQYGTHHYTAHRQDGALRQELSGESMRPRPQRRADGHLGEAGGAPGQQQVRGVGRCHEEDEGDGKHQETQRTPEGCGRRGGQRRHGEGSLLRGMMGMSSPQYACEAVELSVHLLDRTTGSHTPHEAEHPPLPGPLGHVPRDRPPDVTVGRDIQLRRQYKTECPRAVLRRSRSAPPHTCTTLSKNIGVGRRNDRSQKAWLMTAAVGRGSEGFPH